MFYCLLCGFSSKGRAQDATIRFNDTGLSIAFKAEKVSPNSNRKTVLDDKFYSQMYVEKDGNKTLHRVISDRDSGLYFGYDLKVDFDSATGKFSLSIKPLSITPIMEKPLKDLAVGSLSSYPETLDVEDGDTIKLDILEDPRTKAKIVDVIKVKIVGVKDNGSQNSNAKNSAAGSKPSQDFTPEIFQTMKLTNVKIFVNGAEVASLGSIVGASVIYFYIPEKGRFIFSLAPHKGYDFQKIGIVENNEISFAANGDNYKLVSSSPVLVAGGSWSLWVLYDPNFRPDARFSSFSPYWMGAGSRPDDFLKKKQ
jgi:hypothetical protein